MAIGWGAKCWDLTCEKDGATSSSQTHHRLRLNPAKGLSTICSLGGDMTGLNCMFRSVTALARRSLSKKRSPSLAIPADNQVIHTERGSRPKSSRNRPRGTIGRSSTSTAMLSTSTSTGTGASTMKTGSQNQDIALKNAVPVFCRPMSSSRPQWSQTVKRLLCITQIGIILFNLAVTFWSDRDRAPCVLGFCGIPTVWWPP